MRTRTFIPNNNQTFMYMYACLCVCVCVQWNKAEYNSYFAKYLVSYFSQKKKKKEKKTKHIVGLLVCKPVNMCMCVHKQIHFFIILAFSFCTTRMCALNYAFHLYLYAYFLFLLFLVLCLLNISCWCLVTITSHH